MKIALVAGGAIAQDCVAALRLADMVGSIAGPNYRVASRIANALRAGAAVKDYADLTGSPLIMICVPDNALPGVVASLSECGIEWNTVTALLYSARRDSYDLQPLRNQGAQVGSVRPVEVMEDRFLLEGDLNAVRVARRLIHAAKGRAIEVSAGGASAYLAAISFSTSLFTPLIEAAAAALRMAGASAAEASQVAAIMFERSLRSHRHGGRKSWSGPLATGDAEEVFKEADALGVGNPVLARYYLDNCAFALELFARHSKLLRALRERRGERPALTPPKSV